MNSSLNYSLINSTNTDIFVVPAPARLFDDTFSYDDLKLTWNVTNIFNKTMELKFYFSNPYEISPLPTPDKIQIFFRDSNMYFNVDPNNSSYSSIK